MRQDGKIKCDWCGGDVEPEELTVLDLDMPMCTQAYMHIKNDLCATCTGKSLAALGTLELEIRRTVNVPQPDSPGPE